MSQQTAIFVPSDCFNKKQERESIKQGNAILYTMPMISPATSLSRSDSCVSSCSEFSVDVSSCNRGIQEENMTGSSQEDLICRSNGRLQHSSIGHPVNGIDRSKKQRQINLSESSCGSDVYTVRDVQIMQTSDDHEAKGNVNANIGSYSDGTENSNSFEDDTNAEIWEPPEPDDPEDDMEGSVAFNDDDEEECGDGMKWGKPSSLSHYRDEGSGIYRFKEEKQRAMEAVINGKFKALISQLLKSVGVASLGEGGESWVDIIASLSWEAASFLKPDAVVGKAMDPDGYVKVKCIATGVRSQSQLVKGLVFKKHAAHKHMSTKYKNPRLLLIKGVLGQSSSGLSSFDSMEQEKGYLKFVIEMLELCHPDVILVEKTVSRDIQESILDKGMTLIFDMKLHRLERVARCTGSPILSSDTMTSEKLKKCDSFHIEKFKEEHAGGGGKVPSKTLMFIEGCPTRLGCTILLKGAQSDELKKVKCVVQCAVILAYHLIHETAFLVDQRAMFSTLPFADVETDLSTDKETFNLGSINACVHQNTETNAETGSDTVDIPSSNGFNEGCSHDSTLEIEGRSTSDASYNPAVLPGFSSISASLRKVIRENFPQASSSYQSLSSYFGFSGRELNDPITRSVSACTTPEATDHCDVEDKGSFHEERSLHGHNQTSFTCSEASLEVKENGGNSEDQMKSKNQISHVLDSQSILVLMSSQNALRGTVCEQSHFSHIMFYKNFDIPIGKFLQDNLLNQQSQCTSCGELPEAHFYHYAHRNKQLTIRVKRLPGEVHLPGEAEGKLWMWSRCGKCKSRNGISKCTKRVLISTSARCLSFGNFLELNFSNPSLSNLFSSCGHSLQDFLYFFGLGPMVALFKYSPVTTYTVSVPPLKLPFSSSIRQDWLMKETQNVYMKLIYLFKEVANSLEKMRSQFDGLTLKLRGSFKEFSDIEEMLKQEKSEFEVVLKNAVTKTENSDQAAYKLLSLNRVLWELLLEACIWERRLHSLLSLDPMMIHSRASEKVEPEKVDSDIGINLEVKLDTAAETDGSPIEDIPIEGPVQESNGADPVDVSDLAEAFKTPNVDGSTPKRLDRQGSNLRNGSSYDHCENDQLAENVDCGAFSDSNLSMKGTYYRSQSFDLEGSHDWFWAPFSEIRQVGVRDLQRVFFSKFETISSYTAEHLPTAYQLITEEGKMLHIPLGTDNHIVSDYEGELSSMIACALAILKDLPLQTEVLADDSKGESGVAARTFEHLHGLTRLPTNTTLHWSSNGSLDLDSVHNMASISSDESRFSRFDGLNLLDSLVPPGTVNPVVPLGVSKSLGKDKYTVICPYANQFRDLRNRCFQSEVDYIASLSRCRNWDAKGGKSKSFFAKTLDDRLIIKEIKKTEFESFMKFSDEYFKHVKLSFDNGNQTCLAKVLGIYQVIVRQTKSGKEMRHDLMVMENLTFGRNITRQYDLKGALHARFNSATDGSGDVLLDQNFVNDMNSSPLYVSNKAKRILQRAVWNDTTFLNSINVMDYSLLVGVDTERRELVCGIIDYLRQYTWDKQLETWVKSSLVPKNVLPTVISPKEYKRRFRKFMSEHFLSVPDDWCSPESSDPCHQCAVGNDDCSDSKSHRKGGLNS
ncbi:putative 1-phosphatidylinositol-3-phosphate 5-kinase FAB1D isoform X2 [Pyrus x bretschneideri]|uniref:putative 1-phosphatidylinositol-3-phosphate 5-kinase FAB1D isoform X2 n=1 Tax=Pyrus x bretschneideri TaxID=225117 RepID=UPI00202EBFA4|nr:putative 1-phosphatidylinositol-3-phosphate 5-kinase FAB1D isoform X2 [Pyrus x bretschneideri]